MMAFEQPEQLEKRDSIASMYIALQTEKRTYVPPPPRQKNRPTF